MQFTASRVGGFEYAASIEQIEAPRGLSSLNVYSIWEQARAPAAERRVVQFNVDVDGPRALRDLIDAALAEA